MTKLARGYIAAVITTGVAALAFVLSHWQTDDPNKFAVFLLLFMASGTLKCIVPGVNGTFSPVFFFALIGCTSLSFSEVVTASALAAIVQCTYRMKNRPTLVKIAFNASNLALSTASAYAFVQGKIPALAGQAPIVGIILGAAVFYLVNTALVSTVVALAECGSLSAVWKGWCYGALPYYMVGVLITGAANPVVQALSLVTIPAILLATIYLRYGSRTPVTACATQ
jgi:hypothetical protein